MTVQQDLTTVGSSPGMAPFEQGYATTWSWGLDDATEHGEEELSDDTETEGEQDDAPSGHQGVYTFLDTFRLLTSNYLPGFTNTILVGPLAIRRIAEKARDHLLSLRENWDGEGAPKYDVRTVEAACSFLFKAHGASEVPQLVEKVRVLPASEGSVDLHWQTAELELLVNFRRDGSVSYYGDDYNGNLIQGQTCPKPEFVACWMEHTCG